MKNNKSRKTTWIIVICVIIYVALVCLLVLAEHNAPDASITTLPSGFWYSITTLTTVGYGDTYPVTAAGRVLGTIFQIASLGVLAAVVGAILSVLRGTFLPLLKLRFKKNRRWYLFNEKNISAEKLAGHLANDEPDSVIVFAGMDDTAKSDTGVCVSLSPSRLLEIKGAHKDSYVFFMDQNMPENERHAESIQTENAEVVIMTDHEPSVLRPHHHYFNPYENSARIYWHKYPSTHRKEDLVLIGEGKYMYALLEQALIQNIVGDYQHITYRMFGDFDSFLRSHPYLDTSFAVNCTDPNRDNLFFSDEPWDQDHSILKKADRIIICYDEEDQAIETATALLRYVPVAGKIYIRLSNPFDSCITFGSDDEIFTHELVLKNKLSELAVRLHEAYTSVSPGRLPEWDSLTPFLRRSNLASADHLLYKIRYLLNKDPDEKLDRSDYEEAYEVFCSLASPDKQEQRNGCRRMEHERWMRFHVVNNWQYAPVRDNEKRLHPLLLPFEDLSPEDQAKDDYAWELLGKVYQLIR